MRADGAASNGYKHFVKLADKHLFDLLNDLCIDAGMGDEDTLFVDIIIYKSREGK